MQQSTTNAIDLASRLAAANPMLWLLARALRDGRTDEAALRHYDASTLSAIRFLAGVEVYEQAADLLPPQPTCFDVQIGDIVRLGEVLAISASPYPAENCVRAYVTGLYPAAHERAGRSFGEWLLLDELTPMEAWASG